MADLNLAKLKLGESIETIVNNSNSNFTNIEMYLEGLTGITYGVCNTAASTSAKTVTITEAFELKTGAAVLVKFTNINSASSATLNVNSSGAKTIKSNEGADINVNNSWEAATSILLIYNGTNWIWSSHLPSALKTKLQAIEAEAQVNIIEAIKIGSTALTVTGKAITLPVAVPTGAGETAGLMTAADKYKLNNLEEIIGSTINLEVLI